VSVKNVHLDVDQVLLGQPESARDPRWEAFGTAIQPVWVLGAVLALNVLLVALFFKELKLSTFDPGLAASLGFRPAAVHYGLMAVVSITAVAAFDAVGPVLVVGFFVVPAAAAFLLTDRLGVMLLIAGVVGGIGATIGTQAAVAADTNIAGTVATTLGVLFALAFVFAPGRGLFAQVTRRWRQKREFLETILTIHLFQHEGTPAEAEEAKLDGLHEHLSWAPADVAKVVERAEGHGLVVRAATLLKLTAAGRERARAILGAPGA
ncbi:MAG TPA: metal ABC transporter permease, partial [Gemmataceae bacterium]|nr:metal ABC transporter permease [Gemmataceae bacterium]